MDVARHDQDLGHHVGGHGPRCGRRRKAIAVTRRYIELTFERFWKRELDVEDVAVVESVFARVGADVRGFRDSTAGEHVRTLFAEQTVLQAGIFGVPGCATSSTASTYWGREHLPRIRWILEGRRGPAPDIAYQTVTSRLR